MLNETFSVIFKHRVGQYFLVGQEKPVKKVQETLIFSYLAELYRLDFWSIFATRNKLEKLPRVLFIVK